MARHFACNLQAIWWAERLQSWSIATASRRLWAKDRWRQEDAIMWIFFVIIHTMWICGSAAGRFMRKSSDAKQGTSLAICNQNVLCISAIYQFLREALPLYAHGVVVVVDEGVGFCGKHYFLFEQIFLSSVVWGHKVTNLKATHNIASFFSYISPVVWGHKVTNLKATHNWACPLSSNK